MSGARRQRPAMTDAHDEHAIRDEHGTSHAVEGSHGSAADHGDDHGHDDHAHAARRSARSTGGCGASGSWA